MSTDAVYRIKGPSAISGDPRRLLHLSFALAVTDWKLRFFGSMLGYVWSLLRPLMLFGILYVVFSQIVGVSAGVANYPLVLLAGIVLYFTFGEMANGAVTSMVDRETLVRKVSFPRMAIPLSVTMVAALNMLLNLVTVAIFVAASGVEPRWTWLLIPLPLVGLIVFGMGLAMLLSALYVPFRDVKPIWEVISQALFYATPILYPIEKVAERSDVLVKIAMSNPLAVLIQEFRHFLLGAEVPSAAAAMGGAVWLLIPTAIFLGLTALGFWVFNRMSPHAAEQL
ncbi:MAG: type transport system permease protein [Solirubrobacteraceae bacterium]|nr:type transport system permease protein [Solirubrobacteraceae bacterium]